jgi:hypothetical protein
LKNIDDQRPMMPTCPRHNGEAIAEIFLAAVVAQIAERQYNQTQPRSGGRGCRAGPRITGHAADEPIAATRHRLDERRLVGVIAERRAQTLDRRVEAVFEIDEGALRPQPQPQLVACDDLSGPFEQQPQNLERLLLQSHAD